MYLRFQGQKPNLGTSSKLGIFQLAFELRDRHDLPSYAYNELHENLSWLKQHLKSPSVLDDRDNFRAISWFKKDARKPLKRIWAIKAVLEEFGYHIDLVKSRDPGEILYEDGWQIVARARRRPA